MQSIDSGAPMIICRDITKKYNNRIVLSRVSFTMPVGQVTGLIGPNGSGKSTLIRIIAGFELPDSGEITVQGVDAPDFFARKSKLAYMPEYLELYPEYSVRNLIRFLNSSFKVDRPDIVKSLGLDSVNDEFIGRLSKGYKQRLKLYCALVQPKPCVLLDEPFDGFDPIQMMDIFDLIRAESASGRTFFLSIHQLADAEKICNYFLLLDEGKLIAKGTLSELRKNYHNEQTLERIFIKALT